MTISEISRHFKEQYVVNTAVGGCKEACGQGLIFATGHDVMLQAFHGTRSGL